MKNTYFLLLLILLVSCGDNKTVIARVEKVFTTPVRRGYILYYKLSYDNDGKIDTAYLTGNKIQNKETGQVFYFEVGDSINIRLGIKPDEFHQFNKFISIHKLVERKKQIVSVRKNTERKKTRLMSINYVEKIPLLPSAKNNDDNERIISDFFNKKIIENGNVLNKTTTVYLKIDTLGKAYVDKIHNSDSFIVSIISDNIKYLPPFAPAEHKGNKVRIKTSYSIYK